MRVGAASERTGYDEGIVRPALLAFLTGVVLACAACAADDVSPRSVAASSSDAGTSDDGDVDVDARTADSGDPRCGTMPTPLPDHPWARRQATSMDASLRDVRGFHGRVYFGYGDLNANTGPIDLASLDPTTKSWTNHLTAYAPVQTMPAGTVRLSIGSARRDCR